MKIFTTILSAFAIALIGTTASPKPCNQEDKEENLANKEFINTQEDERLMKLLELQKAENDNKEL